MVLSIILRILPSHHGEISIMIIHPGSKDVQGYFNLKAHWLKRVYALPPP